MRVGLVLLLPMFLLTLLSTSCRGSAGGGAETQADIPKGHGVLMVLVQDESGRPLEGAEISIANKNGRAHTTKSRQDGRTKGVEPVADNPFSVRVTMPGYQPGEQIAIELLEGKTMSVTISLRAAP